MEIVSCKSTPADDAIVNVNNTPRATKIKSASALASPRKQPTLTHCRNPLIPYLLGLQGRNNDDTSF